MYWENIPGMFNFDNIYTQMIIKFDNAKFVEIGTWKGKSSAFMAEKIKEYNKKIEFYTIDTFVYTDDYDRDSVGKSFYEEVVNNLKYFSDLNIIKGLSHEIAQQFENDSLDFVFIDGDHSYNGVLADLTAWFPKVKIGGVIGGHDYIEPSCGVKTAVDQYFLFTGIQTNRASWLYYK